MKHTVNFIDHTINGILLENPSSLWNREVFHLLKNYGMTKVDLCETSYEFLKGRLKCPCVRVEYEPAKLLGRTSDKEAMEHFDALLLLWNHGDSFELLERAVANAKSAAGRVSIKLLNAFQLEEKDFQEYEQICLKYGVDSILYCDPDSRLDPFMTADKLEKAKNSLSCRIEFCAGNGLGLAAANSLTAIRCGIYNIHTVVGGANLKEGAAMEEMLLAVKHLDLGRVCEETGNLARDCRRILDYLNLTLPVDKAVIGEGIFSHESGIHVDGIMKNPRLYETISPEEVGVERKILIGKHSGRASFRIKYQMLGIELKEEEISVLLKEIKERSSLRKLAFTEEELLELYSGITGRFAAGGG